MKVRLIHFGGQSSELQYAWPHLIGDGVVMQIFTKELVAIYNALKNRKAPQLQPILLEYPDYVLMERKQVNPHLKRDSDFWKDYIQNHKLYTFPKNLLNLHAYHEEEESSYLFEISPLLVEDLKKECLAHNLSTFSVLLAIVGKVLADLTNQQSGLLTFIQFGRIDPGTESLIGNFYNVHIIAIENASRDIKSLGENIQEEIRALTPYQQCPAIMKMAFILSSIQNTSVNSILTNMGAYLLSPFGKNAQIPPLMMKALIYIASTKIKELFFNKITKLYKQKQIIDPGKLIIVLNVQPDFFSPTENPLFSDLISKNAPLRLKTSTAYSRSFPIIFFRKDSKPFLYIGRHLSKEGQNLFVEKFIHYLKEAVKI